MKLTNYNYGYSDFFDCSIHGQIKMTQEEFQEMLNNKLIYRSIFNLDDLDRKLTKTKNSYLMNLRANATEKIAEIYNLKKYKPQNYRLLISF